MTWWKLITKCQKILKMSFEKKNFRKKQKKFKKSWEKFFWKKSKKNSKILKNSKFLEFFQKIFFAQINVIWSVKYKIFSESAFGTWFMDLPMCNYQKHTYILFWWQSLITSKMDIMNQSQSLCRRTAKWFAGTTTTIFNKFESFSLFNRRSTDVKKVFSSR